MKTRRLAFFLPALAATALTGCATSGYSPPPERRADTRCPVGEVWICEDRYPSRLGSEQRPAPFCRCDDPRHLR